MFSTFVNLRHQNALNTHCLNGIAYPWHEGATNYQKGLIFRLNEQTIQTRLNFTII